MTVLSTGIMPQAGTGVSQRSCCSRTRVPYTVLQSTFALKHSLGQNKWNQIVKQAELKARSGALSAGAQVNNSVVETTTSGHVVADVVDGGRNSILGDIWNFLKQMKRVLGLSLAMFVLGATTVEPAYAARSGGRMGGMRSFSSARSSSGFGSAGSSMRRMDSGGSRGMMGSYGSPYRSSVRTNAFFFSPFGFGFGYGYPMGGGFMSLLFWGVFAAIMLQVIRGTLSSGRDDEEGYIGGGSSYGKLSVAKVQVGLMSNARELQRDLESIAARADTSGPRGLHYVLQETVLSLMRNPDYCVYGFAKSGIEDSPEQAEARFNKLSLEERGKFQKETRVNVGGMRQQSSMGQQQYSGSVSELIVVTILVAAEGRVRLPKVNSRVQLRDALSTLGSIPAEDIYAVEVLWTPEEEGDYFTTDDLAYDYPLLNTL